MNLFDLDVRVAVITGSSRGLFSAALAAGANAAGQSHWGLVPGARADALVLNPHAPALLGLPASHSIDALVLARGETGVKDAPGFSFPNR